MGKKFFYLTLVYTLNNQLSFGQEIKQPSTMLIIDTEFSDPYYFDTLIRTLIDQDFIINVKPWYEINTTDISQADFYYIESSLMQLAALINLKNVGNHLLHVQSAKLLMLIQEIKKTKKPLIIGITQTNNPSSSLAIYLSLLELLNVSSSSQINQLILHLSKPSAFKSMRYDTALLVQKDSQSSKKNFNSTLPLLPSNKSTWLPELQPLYPFGGIISKNPLIILISSSYTHALDIQEDFMLVPINKMLRNNFTKNLVASWQDVKKLLIPSSIPSTSIPHTITQDYSTTQRQIARQERRQLIQNFYQWIDQEGIACAWMHLNPFKAADPTEQISIAERLLKSRINLLWLELMPEMYLGKRSLATKQTKDSWLMGIEQFTKALHIAAKNTKLPIPQILVGMELTWNFANKPPEDPARDIYGKQYVHIPSPLDTQNFWQDEVIDVFQKFYELWTQIGNNIPLAGAFLDLEMYHAPKEIGQFLNTMDFSETAWQIFTKKSKKPELKDISDHNKRVAYLLEHNLISNYFSILSDQAQNIGKLVAKKIRSILPHALIGVYNINLPYNWFYKGFLSGLSSSKDPVILTTFNLEAYRHYPWLSQNNIHIFHIPPLLLSKLRKINDFNIIPELACRHDGIWFNRFSQLEEKVKDYTNVEVPPLPTDVVINEFEKILPPFKTCK